MGWSKGGCRRGLKGLQGIHLSRAPPVHAAPSTLTPAPLATHPTSFEASPRLPSPAADLRLPKIQGSLTLTLPHSFYPHTDHKTLLFKEPSEDSTGRAACIFFYFYFLSYSLPSNAANGTAEETKR